MKRLILLGATGSVGRRALELVDQFPGRFRVEGLAARGSDPATVAEAQAELRLTVKARDPKAVGKPFTAPIVEIGPLVLGTEPRTNGTNAPRDATIQVTFTEPVDLLAAVRKSSSTPARAKVWLWKSGSSAR